ncbi:YLP motif-containing protein 1-like isoform X1 [Leptidea sinapis]|uniref:YLP motif-containing protein 1-like isoform X1 n=1 Tax=Leptidea sinapis TaxID=189913 RepID=UPI00213B7FF2|nr:YLP motif-containing protein 1-like isoform X1 [Leptidea sinapis]
MAWPAANGQWVPSVQMNADPASINMGSYTPEQWNLLQQQNWQQWAQWQQQYAQWQSQYGESYAKQMQAMQPMGGGTPLPPKNIAPPPAPPPPEKPPPPPPPHENDQPLYCGDAKQTESMVVSSQQFGIKTSFPTNSDNNDKWSYNKDVRAIETPAVQSSTSVNTEALKKLAEEERLFDIQFQRWEEEIRKWKEENVNHPDKVAYSEYEQKFEACRAQLLERRRQMNQKRASLMNTAHHPASNKNSGNTYIPPNTSIPPPINVNLNKNTQEATYNTKPNQNYSTNKEEYGYGAKKTQYGYNRTENMNIDPQDRYDLNQHMYTPEKVEKPSFLPNSERIKGIPGLDLVPEVEKPNTQEVIEIPDDQGTNEKLGTSNPTTNMPPDYLNISKGINNILGDEKIMNILSMVQNQKPPLLFNNQSSKPNISVNPSNAQFNTDTSLLSQNIKWNMNDNNYNRINNFNIQNTTNDQQNSNKFFHMQQRPPPQNYKDTQKDMHNVNYDEGYGQYDNNSQGQHSNQFGNTQMPSQGQGRPQISRPSAPSIRPLLSIPVQRPPLPQRHITPQRPDITPRSNAPVRLGAPQRPNAPLIYNAPQTPNLTQIPNAPQTGSLLRPDYLQASVRQNAPPELPVQQKASFDNPNKYSGGYAEIPPQENIALNSVPPKPKWVEEPIFTPSIIVEYDHLPLRLKARDFIEPVHMFDYNHKSKDGDVKKRDFEREVDELYTILPNESDRYRDFERRPPVGSRDDHRSKDFTYDYVQRDDRNKFDEKFGYRRQNEQDRFKPDDLYKDRVFDSDRIYGRDRERDNGRDRLKDMDRGKYRERDIGWDRDRESGRDRDRSIGKDRDSIERDRDSERERDRTVGRERDRVGRERDRDFERDRGRERRDSSYDRPNNQYRLWNRDIYRNTSDSKDQSRKSPTNQSPERDSRKRLHVETEKSSSKKPKESGKPGKNVIPQQIIMIDDILEPPGREMRPEKILIIMRGPPGSGKSYLAKLIRDREAEFGGTARIMSIDDYFMQEGEIEETDPTTGKTIKKPSLKYEYDENYEESYTNSLKKAVKRTISDGYFPFLIFDAVNDQLKSYADVWNYARQCGFQVYICTLELDPQVCFKRNIHNRTMHDIQTIAHRFFKTPDHHILLDPTTLLQNAAIPDVHMEDAVVTVEEDNIQEQDEVETSFTSKWEKMDDASKLARLDGTSKPLRSSQLTMEDYLQLDDWTPSKAKPGKKSVRWADIEERREQEKMRAIGFVVGQTDWNRMTDPTMGSSALTQTKYIERVKRN